MRISNIFQSTLKKIVHSQFFSHTNRRRDGNVYTMTEKINLISTIIAKYYQRIIAKYYHPIIAKYYQPINTKYYQPIIYKHHQPITAKYYQPIISKYYQPIIGSVAKCYDYKLDRFATGINYSK